MCNMYKTNIYLHIYVYLHTHIGLWIKHTRMCILRLVNDEWFISQGRKSTKYFLCISMFIGSWLYTNNVHANTLQLLGLDGREGMKGIYAYIREMILGQFWKISWEEEVRRRCDLRQSHKYVWGTVTNNHKYSVCEYVLEPEPVDPHAKQYSVSHYKIYKQIIQKKCYTENYSAFCPTILYNKEGKEIALIWARRVFDLCLKVSSEFLRSWF